MTTLIFQFIAGMVLMAGCIRYTEKPWPMFAFGLAAIALMLLGQLFE
jgi:hypothetical protein